MLRIRKLPEGANIRRASKVGTVCLRKRNSGQRFLNVTESFVAEEAAVFFEKVYSSVLLVFELARSLVTENCVGPRVSD